MSDIDFAIEQLNFNEIINGFYEDFNEFKGIIKLQDFEILSLDKINGFIANNDSYRVDFYTKPKMNKDFIEMSSWGKGEDFESFKKEVESFKDEKELDLKLEIIIMKSEKSNIAIYDLKLFANYLQEANLNYLIKKFTEKFLKGKILFKVMNEHIEELKTNSIIFTNNPLSSENNYGFNRDLIKNKVAINSTFVDKMELIPEDFFVIEKSKVNNEQIINLFEKLEFVISLMILIDNVQIKENNNIQGFINGYKKIDINLDYKIIKFNKGMNYLNEIYYWAYSDKNVIDKLGIVSNVISISLKENNSILDLDFRKIFESIKSAHNVYQKENVKNYLEVRSKLSENIIDLTFKYGELANELKKNIQEISILLITIYSATFIGNLLIGKGSTFTLSKSIWILSTVMLVISYMYLKYCKKNILTCLDRYTKLYYRIKNSYSDILTPIDLNEILNNDKDYIEDKEFVETKIKEDYYFWIKILIIIFFTTTILTYHKEFLEVLKVILNTIISLI